MVAAGASFGIALAMSGATGASNTPASVATGYSGYGAMMGGVGAPQWMVGGAYPGAYPGTMMSGATDPGRVMGGWLANAPGPRISAGDAERMSAAAPAGATVDQAARSIVFTTTDVRFTALAGPGDSFRIAGLTNPAITVPVGATVTIQVINADPDVAHGLVVTGQNVASVWMPMMVAAPAFPDAAVWALGEPTAAGLHTATVTFTASQAGSYAYLCAVPGHAQLGMVGRFLVQSGTG